MGKKALEKVKKMNIEIVRTILINRSESIISLFGFANGCLIFIFSFNLLFNLFFVI